MATPTTPASTSTDCYAQAASADLDRNESRTRWVVALTLVTMVVEIAVGRWSGSMALTADGWHMGSHAGALGLSLVGYAYARRHRDTGLLSFGEGKVLALAGYTSAVFLGLGALWMVGESGWRLLNPVDVRFDEAIGVAVLGLLVNVISAFILDPSDHGHDHHHHGHGHDHHHHGHGHDHHHGHAHDKDPNLTGAYLHVLADALTSVLAIVALLAGRFAGWTFLDPVMGIVGGLLVARWSVGLLRQTASTLLDQTEPEVSARVKALIEANGDEVLDLHIWQPSPGDRHAIVTVATSGAATVDTFKDLLLAEVDIKHLTVEVQRR